MPDKMKGAESTTAGTERRASQRVRASSPIYVELGKGNGGIVTWISESGLALTAAGILEGRDEGDELLKMQIQLPEFPGAIEANGRIVWKSKSGKEAGVRFVDLGEAVRDRIQKWISAETCKNGFRVGQPEFPKMQSPTASGPKKRGPRFSFSDVASSRVGTEEEAQPGDFLGAAREAEAPSSPPKSGTVVDASKDVASAFERAAFTEEPKTEVSRDRRETRTPPPPEEAGQGRPALSFPERRSHPRRPILLFTYAVLGDDNGGLVFNLGEGGLALTAAATLRDSHFAQMRVRFPDSQDSIEAQGRLAWISDSGKEAGIEFVALAEEVRARIREWVSRGEPAGDFQGEEGDVPKNQDQPSEPPSFTEPVSPVSIARESTAPFEVRLATPVASRSALILSGRSRAAEIKPPKPAQPAGDAVQPESRVGRKALLAAAVILFLSGIAWTFLQRNYLKEASGLVAQNVPKAAIPSEPREERQVDVGKSTADPGIEPIPDVAPQAKTMESGAQNLETAKDPGANRALQNQTAVSLEHGAALDSRLRAPDRRKPKTAASREPRLEPRRGLAPAPLRARQNGHLEGKSLESKPVSTAQVRPAPLKELNAAPPPLSAMPIQPEAASTFGKENDALLAAPKPPEVPVARTPIVTVSFDSFLSIRMPEKENAKKSRQGKSLQIGHLVLRMDPVYPEQAKKEGVEGAVKIHIVLGREGTVKSLTPISGLPLLVPAAMNAVRQWRFSPTILGGQAMETEEDVTVSFRLSNAPSKN